MRQLMVLGFLRRRGHAKAEEVKAAFYFTYPGVTEQAVHRRFSDDMGGYVVPALSTTGT